MVLQQAPAKAAVYGIAVGNPTAVKVTVTDVEAGTSYEVDAEFNTTKQPFGPAFVGGACKFTVPRHYCRCFCCCCVLCCVSTEAVL